MICLWNDLFNYIFIISNFTFCILTLIFVSPLSPNFLSPHSYSIFLAHVLSPISYHTFHVSVLSPLSTFSPNFLSCLAYSTLSSFLSYSPHFFSHFSPLLSTFHLHFSHVFALSTSLYNFPPHFLFILSFSTSYSSFFSIFSLYFLILHYLSTSSLYFSLYILSIIPTPLYHPTFLLHFFPILPLFQHSTSSTSLLYFLKPFSCSSYFLTLFSPFVYILAI